MTELTEFVQTLGPNVFYAVLIGGMWLAITAVYLPGMGAPEVTSLITLLVAGAGLLVLPTNVIGFLLLIAALICFLLLIFFRGVWALAIVGAVLQVIGSVFLFRAGSRPSIWVMLIMNAAALAYHQIILMPGLRIQEMKKRVGASTLIGMEGRVTTALDPVGTIHILGELWSARAGQSVEAGRQVRITGRSGLLLKVEPVEALTPPERDKAPEGV